MKNFKMLIAYDGTAYLGWQKTKMGPSIEEWLEKVLSQVLQEKVSLQAASRTDAGVHAQGQVVNFHTEQNPDLYKLKRALNGLLPKDISIFSLEETVVDFHPTLHNQGKEYHYHLCLGAVQLPFHRAYSWHFPFDLDISLMQKASQELVGTHDFASFCNQRPDLPECTLRTLTALEILPLANNRLKIIIQGKDFLYKMVRNIVGTLVYIGCGKLQPSVIALLLNHKDRTQAGVTAPAHGLSLYKIFYI